MLILNELYPEYEQVSSVPQGCDQMSPQNEEYTSLPSQRPLLTKMTLSIYTSAPSRFIVDGKSLYIHGQLVSRHSNPLSAKINAKKDFIIIDSVDKDTFIRFIEWAYKGYYTAAEYQIDAESPSLSKFEDSDTCTPEAESFPSAEEAPARPPREPEPEPEPEVKPPTDFGELEDAFARGFGPKKDKKNRKKGSSIWDIEFRPPTPPSVPQPMKSSKESIKESFYARKYEIRQEIIPVPPPRSNQGPNENYTPIFLSHANLYVFARRYDIPSLQTLALENLHMALDRFTLYPERTGDIIKLLRCIYHSRELKEGAEEMREMLRGYMGFQMDVLMKDREFRGLMKEEGELLDDFVEMVGKRI